MLSCQWITAVSSGFMQPLVSRSLADAKGSMARGSCDLTPGLAGVLARRRSEFRRTKTTVTQSNRSSHGWLYRQFPPVTVLQHGLHLHEGSNSKTKPR